MTKDLDKQENIHNIVEAVLGSNIKLGEEQKHDILTQVETQHQNLKEVISYTNFLLDSVIKAKSNLSHETKLRATVVAKNDQLQGQLERLTTDVKHDKDFIKALLIGTRESEDCE